MKRKCFFLGASLTMLLTAVFAQPAGKKESAENSLSIALAEKAMRSEQLIFKGSAKSSGPVLKLLSAVKSDNSDKTILKVIVEEGETDGSGYQFLIDSKHQLCDNLNVHETHLPEETNQTYYDQADIKIPENASPVVGTTSLMAHQETEKEIDGGIYDVLVVNPSYMSDGVSVRVWLLGGNGAFLNDVEFMAGYTYTFLLSASDCSLHIPYELAAQKITLPVIGCETGSEIEIRLTVANQGEQDLSDLTFWYSADPSGMVRVKEICSDTIKAGTVFEYTFNTAMEILEDSLYTIFAGVEPIEGEAAIDNNSISGLFKKQDVADVPYSFDIDQYDLMPETRTSWIIDGGTVSANNEPGVPLVSRCLKMDAGKKYRISYDYWAGIFFWMAELKETYHISFGLTSDDLSAWQKIHEEEKVYVKNWTNNAIVVEPQETGIYAFCFSADGLGIMGVRNVIVTEIVEHDARLNTFVTNMPHIVPFEQANGNFEATVTVQNQGIEIIDKAFVSVIMGDEEIGKAELENILPDSVAAVQFPLTVSGLEVGDRVALSVTVTIADEMEWQQNDNMKIYWVEVSDSVMAYDHVVEGMYTEIFAVGTFTNGDISLPFSLIKQDTLTGISVGWRQADEDMSVGIRIHKYNRKNMALGKLIYESEERRGLTAGQREYDIPPMVLEAGDYMVSIIQDGSVSYGLITDRREDGISYLATGGPVITQKGIGTPSIRTVFGHNGTTETDTETNPEPDSRLLLYPNPVADVITVHAEGVLIDRISVFNLAGIVICQSNRLHTTDFRYNVGGLAPGLYFVRVETEQGVSVLKFAVR